MSKVSLDQLLKGMAKKAGLVISPQQNAQPARAPLQASPARAQPARAPLQASPARAQPARAQPARAQPARAMVRVAAPLARPCGKGTTGQKNRYTKAELVGLAKASGIDHQQDMDSLCAALGINPHQVEVDLPVKRCSTEARGDDRYTRDDIKRIAMARGIKDITKKTMTELCAEVGISRAQVLPRGAQSPRASPIRSSSSSSSSSPLLRASSRGGNLSMGFSPPPLRVVSNPMGDDFVPLAEQPRSPLSLQRKSAFQIPAQPSSSSYMIDMPEPSAPSMIEPVQQAASGITPRLKPLAKSQRAQALQPLFEAVGQVQQPIQNRPMTRAQIKKVQQQQAVLNRG